MQNMLKTLPEFKSSDYLTKDSPAILRVCLESPVVVQAHLCTRLSRCARDGRMGTQEAALGSCD